jgi:hypothetical protein
MPLGTLIVSMIVPSTPVTGVLRGKMVSSKGLEYLLEDSTDESNTYWRIIAGVTGGYLPGYQIDTRVRITRQETHSRIVSRITASRYGSPTIVS